MEHLYAPWRYDYVSEEKIEGCVFWSYFKKY